MENEILRFPSPNSMTKRHGARGILKRTLGYGGNGEEVGIDYLSV